jgi:hypothetical protein
MRRFFNKNNLLFLLYFLPFFSAMHAQQLQVFVQEDSSFSNLPALHSGAVVPYQDKIIFVGGRSNGLHGFHPPLAFPTGGRNTNIFVFAPLTNSLQSCDLTQLNDSLFEQLSSSNLQYVRDGDYLYILGGYGWNNQQNDFTTYDGLIRFHIPTLLDSIASQGSILPAIRVMHDPLFKVCGGHLKKVDNAFYLVFGHSFDGIYNRQDNTGFFVQHYTNRVHRFSLGGPDGMSLTNHMQWYDSLGFHRRDYNLNVQRFPDGTAGLVAFSGVFRRGVNLPYYTPVEIHSDSCREISFNQQFAHYHSATASLYDSLQGRQYHVFLGGMASYYRKNGQVVYDSLVPFVKSISMLSRSYSGTYQEWLMNDTLPGYLGTNAFFVPLQGVPVQNEEVIRLDLLPPGVQQIGWMIGGIESPYDNISDSDPSLSVASNRVFRVYVTSTITGTGNTTNLSPAVTWENPCSRHWDLVINQCTEGIASLKLFDLSGKQVRSAQHFLKNGCNRITENVAGLPAGMYLFALSSDRFTTNGKVFVAGE